MDAQLWAAILGSSSVAGLLQFFVTRHFSKKDKDEEGEKLIKKTLAAVTYSLVSNEIDKLINKGYATSEERRALEILYDAYKANGWNGDMEARMEIVHKLPFRKEEVKHD